MFNAYVTEIGSRHPPFNLDTYPFKDKIDDPDVIEAFHLSFASVNDKRKAIEVLKSMVDKNGWRPDDIAALSNVDASEYYGIFKEHEGTELRKLIDACLQFDRFADEGTAERVISNRLRTL
jgi:hypothetical protein